MVSEAPRLAPHSLEAEQSVLGAILLDNRALATAVTVVTVEDFYRTAHQKIYRAILDLQDVDGEIDQITLTERLKIVGELQAVGGASYLAELWGGVPSAANVRTHATVIHEHAVRRRYIETAQRMQEAAYADAPLSQLAHHATVLRLPLVSDPAPHDAPRATADDKGLIRELADTILFTDHFARDAGGQLYVFERGAYRPHGDEHIARQVKRLLEARGDTKRWSSHRARETAEYLRVDAPLIWAVPPPDTLNLQNGLLDLATHTLRPHTPDHRSPVQLPVVYDPEATCSAWDTFCSQVLPQDCQTLAYELAALTMRPDLSNQQAVLCIGDGANGKSVLLAALTAFIGRENVAGLSLQRLESDKFSVVRLLGKLANICPDLPSDHLVSTSVFKGLTGGDQISAERKFQGSFEFVSYARLIFSANHYPQSKDSSQAFFRRWFVMPFERIFSSSEQRPRRELDAQLAQPAELSGVLNRALEALSGILARGRLSQSESTRTAMMEFQTQTDPLAAWLDRCTDLTPGGMVSKKDLHIAYGSYADATGRPPMSPKSFYAGVKRLRPTLTEAQRRVHGEVRDVFLGVELRSTIASEVSALSAHSAHSYQISLQCREIEEEEDKNLNKGNALNELTPLTEAGDACFACESTRFWKSVHGSVVCAMCHPPRNGALVAEWIERETVKKW
jgi:P4 family phage/plasmid primase-like protien